MPDPTRKTISATEASVLFEASPWITPWMLYRRFAHGDEPFVAPHSRMDWGKKMEPLLLEQAAADLRFEIRPNVGPDGEQIYVRNGLFGCTRDANIICPDRGPGTCETKCVFDYRIWMQEWDGGNKVPHQYEIQLQTQMKVGDGEGNAFKWGVFAVWVAGEMFYFERKPVPKFWEAMDREAQAFFERVAKLDEPEPFGSPREFPLLSEVFPVVETKELDLREGEEGLKLGEAARMFEYHREQRLGHARGEDAIKSLFQVKAKGNGKILLPQGIITRLKQNKTGIGLKVHVPADVREGAIGDA
jgi:hypothetical protein